MSNPSEITYRKLKHDEAWVIRKEGVYMKLTLQQVHQMRILMEDILDGRGIFEDKTDGS